MNRDEWRWTDENGVQRLVRTEELRAALASSVLPPSTLVWREGMKEWAAAFTVPELASAAISAARAGRPGSTPPPAHAGASDRDTPTDVMPLDPAPRAPGRPLPDRPAPKSSAPPLPAGKRPPMRTLVGLSSPDDERPSVPNMPIVVPAAGGQKPEAGRGAAITQLPKYGGGADPLVPTIPLAPLVPSGLPQRGRPQERKARTSDIDALWAGSPPRDDDEPTIQGAARPEKAGSSAKPAGTTAAERARAGGAWAGEAARPVEGASPSKRPPPPLPPREARAAAASARLGAAVSTKPASPPSAAPAEARPPAKPKTLPPARPKRTDPEVAGSKPAASTRPPALQPRAGATDARTPAATPKPAAARQADAAPPLATRLEAGSPTLSATAKPAEIAGIKVPPPAPSSAPSLEELRNVSLKKTLAGGISAFVASGAPLPTPPAPTDDVRPAPAEAPAKAAAAAAGPTLDALSWQAEAAPARGDAPAVTESAPSSAAMDAAPAPLPSSGTGGDADRPRAPSERPPSLESATSRSERPPSLSSRPPSLSERPPSLRAEVELLTSIGRSAGASKALEQPITVPLSSLVFGVGGFVVISLVLVFFVGRCSVGSAEARTGAQKGVARASVLARSALPVPARPCSVLRNPTMWAPQASKSIPFELGSNGVGLFTIGYAKSEEEAAGLTFDFESNEVKERSLPKPEGKIDRVTPLAGDTPTFAVSPEAPGRTLVHVPATPPFVILLEKTGIATAADPTAAPTTLWPLEGIVEPEAARVLVARDGAGYAVTFRRGGGIFAGWLGADRKPVGNPVRVVGSGGSVGKPNLGYNGRELAVVFADKAPGGRSRWEIRVGRAPRGSIPEQAKVIPMPKGGPGGDAFAPDIAGLPDGRWLLVWTEGAPGKRAVRGQTLAPDLTPIGDAVALSPPQGNFGQGVLGVVGDRAAAVFLSKGESSYELWGAILGCG